MRSAGQKSSEPPTFLLEITPHFPPALQLIGSHLYLETALVPPSPAEPSVYFLPEPILDLCVPAHSIMILSVHFASCSAQCALQFYFGEFLELISELIESLTLDRLPR